MFGVNMTFILSSEVKKCIHDKHLNFFLLYTSLSIEEMQILHLQGEV